MKAAIMQPYVFPYIGYFQLVSAVDIFVFYDDVNYIKKGWINRNRILVNNEASLFTIPVLKASQNKLIHEIKLGIDEKWLRQFYSTLEHNYKKAPHYHETILLIQQVLNQQTTSISELAIASIELISNYLKIPTSFDKSSTNYQTSKGMDKAERLIEICKLNHVKTYINPSGGKELYNKSSFKAENVELFFIENKISSYKQFNTDFVGGLSIIDVLMFNSQVQVKDLLTQYELK